MSSSTAVGLFCLEQNTTIMEGALERYTAVALLIFDYSRNGPFEIVVRYACAPTSGSNLLQ